jgi:hypothetical protein
LGILHSYYTFKLDAPLRTYIKKKQRSLKPRYTLCEILTILKDIIRDEEMFDMRNPAMIICDQELENALNMKALHVTEIRELVYSQLVRLPEILQTVLKRRRKAALPPSTPICQPRIIKKPESINIEADIPIAIKILTFDKPNKDVKISFTLDPAIFANEKALFKLKPQFRAALSSLPLFPHTKTLFSYTDITKLMSNYILSNKGKYLDQRNIKVALIKGDPLSLAFDCDCFHRCQITSLLRKQLIYVMMRDSNTEKLSINLHLNF